MKLKPGSILKTRRASRLRRFSPPNPIVVIEVLNEADLPLAPPACGSDLLGVIARVYSVPSGQIHLLTNQYLMRNYENVHQE